jgi:hypothetical protein
MRISWHEFGYNVIWCTGERWLCNECGRFQRTVLRCQVGWWTKCFWSEHNFIRRFSTTPSSQKNQLPRYSRTLSNTSILFHFGDSALQTCYRNQLVNVVGKCVTVYCGGKSKHTHTHTHTHSLCALFLTINQLVQIVTTLLAGVSFGDSFPTV